MVCPSCGKQTSFAGPRCAACETVFAVSSQATVGALTPPADLGAETIAPGAVTYGGGETIGPPRATGAETFDADTTGLPASARGVRHVRRAEGGPLATGQSFGPRYHIIKLLGVGGMGAVYQTWDSDLGVAVALKVILPEVTADARAVADLERRFKNELLLARQVTHKNVVRIHDLGEIEGIKYITMGFVEGDDLATLIPREGTLGLARSLKLARQIAAGLEAAHEAGVVHRDLKPPNIMIAADDQALIMDFGIARSTAGPDRGAAVDSIVGTLEYMAPEQARGGVVDQRADIYAFGLILYEMLVGRRKPSGTESALDAMKARIETGVPNLRSISTEIPETVDQVVAKCLEIDPANRYQTSTELLAALNGIDDQGEPIPEPRRLTARLMASVAVLVIAIVTVMYFVVRRAVTPPVQPPPTSVLVLDVENQTGDPVFNGSVEETVARGIEGASFINAYPRASAQKLADQLKPGSRLDEEIARLVARSEGIHVLLASTVAPKGSGYAVSVRAIDPAAEGNSKPLAVAEASASTKELILQTVGTLAAKIRGPLGDTTPESTRLAAVETFTTSSAEAVKSYTLGQDLLFAGRTAEAFDAYQRAIEQDPKFGRAYAGAAIAARRSGRGDEALALWNKAISFTDRMTDREKYRTLGGYYLDVVQNYQKAIESFTTLVNAYPADRAGHASLALAYFWALNIPKALEEEKLALGLDPKSVLARVNYALYAMYAGDFETGAKEAKQVIAQEPTLDLAYVPLATAALARGDSAGAREAYAEMARLGPSGASLAATGLADIAVYEGRYADVEAIVKPAIAEDKKNGNVAGVSAKWVVLAEAYEEQRKTAAAGDAAREALKLAKGRPLQVVAAGILIRAGQDRDAQATAGVFSQQLATQSRAYGKILEGQIALKQRRWADAVDSFTAAQKLADLWIARFHLGVAYVEAGAFAEGLEELDRCQKRRGEATAIFLDEIPSFRYLATLPYWHGRAQEGVGQRAAAAENYKKYLARRGNASRDPLAADARRRLGSL